MDCLSVVIGLLAGYALLPLRGVDNPVARLSHGFALTFFGLVLFLLLFRDGQYSASRRMSRLADTASLGKNMVLAYLITMGISFATKGFFTGYGRESRSIVFTDLLVVFLLMLSARYALRLYQVRLFARGETVRRFVVVGGGEEAADFIRFIDQRPWLGVGCAKILSLAEVAQLSGGPAAMRRALDEVGADEFIIAAGPEEREAVWRAARQLMWSGVPFRLVPSLFEETYRAAKLAGFEELPVVDVYVDPLDRVQRVLKRGLDLAFAGGVLLLGAPVFLIIGSAIKVTSAGPVLFRRERVGQNGHHFVMFKFRTMVSDAEQKLAELRNLNEADGNGHIFKLRQDPRITRVGARLRKWSLDELPQFLNVVRGDMSVIGPRPPLPREVEGYETQHFCRLKGKPGISGLWQVSGRSDLTFEEMVRLDRYYLENWSLGMDLKIMLKTIYVVLVRKGAY